MVRACSPCSQPKWFLRPFGLQHRSRIYKAHTLFYNPVQKTLSSLHGAEVYLQQRMKIMANKQKLSTYKQTLPVRGRGKPELNWTCHKFMVLPLSIQSTLQKTYYVVTNQHLLCCIEHISSSGALVHCIEEGQLVLLSYLNYLVQEMTPEIYLYKDQLWNFFEALKILWTTWYRFTDINTEKIKVTTSLLQHYL